MSPNDLLDKARQLNAAGTAYALITVVRTIAPTSAYVGAQAIVLADGALLGWIGGGCAKSVVIGAAQAAIASGKPRLVRISNDALLPEEDVEQFTMACASNGTIELFIQPHGARGELCVLGATPAAEEARFLAQRLRIGLSHTPGDAAVVLVATQGQGDEEALDIALRSAAPHVLLIASRRKADKLREAMRQRGVGDAQLAKLQAPAGPDAGAKTPAEIALLAIAGVLGRLRGREPGATISVAAAGSEVPSQRAPSSSAHGARKPLPLPAIAPLPGQFINPVCGMAVQMASATHVETYEGQAYYFCCDGCWVTFRQDPAKYAAPHHARG
jgi:xanthine dehydrogenase accessory factor